MGLTTKVAEATLDSGEGGGSGKFGPVGPAPVIDGGGSVENRHGGGDGAGLGLGLGEGTAGSAGGETT